MQELFIGREKELADLEELYLQERFQLFVLYEEALLLRQEVQEPGVYSAIIEAIASGYTKAILNEAKSDDSILLVDLAELMKF